MLTMRLRFHDCRTGLEAPLGCPGCRHGPAPHDLQLISRHAHVHDGHDQPRVLRTGLFLSSCASVDVFADIDARLYNLYGALKICGSKSANAGLCWCVPGTRQARGA